VFGLGGVGWDLDSVAKVVEGSVRVRAAALADCRNERRFMALKDSATLAQDDKSESKSPLLAQKAREKWGTRRRWLREVRE
jgi:hypothetical protein